MGVPIQVRQNAVKVSGTASRPYLLISGADSQSTIYVGQNSSVSLNSYAVPLAPGASITWTDIHSEVWAITATGGTANLTVAYEASGTFTPTPAGSNVTLLKTLSIPFTTASTTITGNIQDLTVSGYQSLTVMVSVNLTTAIASPIMNGFKSGLTPNGYISNIPCLGAQATATGVLAPDTTNAFINIGGVQYESTYAGQSSTFSRTNSALFSFGDGVGNTTGLSPAIQTYQFNVTNQMASFYINAYKRAAIAIAGSITIRVYGSQVSVIGTQYVNQPDPSGNVSFYMDTWSGSTGTPAAITLNADPSSGLLASLTSNGYVSGTNTTWFGYLNIASKAGSPLISTRGAAASSGIYQALYTSPTTLNFVRIDNYPTLATTTGAPNSPLLLATADMSYATTSPYNIYAG